MTEKEKYFLNYLKEQKLQQETLELPVDLISALEEKAKEKGFSISELINFILKDYFIEKEKEKFTGEFEDIVDIFDLYDIENILETKRKHLVINPNGKHLVIVPCEEYEQLCEELKDE